MNEFNQKKNDLVISIHKKRTEVASAMLAVDAIASGGPDNALAKLAEAEELIREYKDLVGG